MRVVVIPGDGIGPDVVGAAQAVLEATGLPFEWDLHEIGSKALSASGSSLPETALQAIREATLALKGPVATPAGSSGERSTNVALAVRSVSRSRCDPAGATSASHHRFVTSTSL